MWRIFHGRITRCIEQATFHRHYFNSHLPQNNLILIQELTEILKNKKWKSLIKLASLKNKLNPYVVRSVLHQDQLSNHLERLLSFFQWSKHKVGIQSDLEMHSFLAARLCSNNLYSPANSVLENVIRFGLPPLDVLKSIDNCRKNFDESRKFDHVVFGLLMDKYREKGYLFEAASVVFAHSNDLDCIPSLLYCNRLLTDLLKDGNFRLFWRVCDAMREANVTFNALTYTSMADAHCIEGNVSDAKEVLAEMEEKGLCSSNFTYKFLMKGLFRAGYVDEAIEVKKSMFAKSLVPNRYFYATFIDGLCAANRFREAIMVLAEMSEMGVKPDAMVYEALLDCYLRHDNVDEAFKIKDAKGITLTLCNTLLHVLCKCSKMEKANELVDEMTRKGIMPGSTTYALLIEGHCQWGNVATALELLEEMKKKNLASVESTYCMITDCLCHNKDPNTAMSSLPNLIMKKGKGKRNAHTWRTLLMNYPGKGHLLKLRGVVEAMHKHGIVPATPHYNILIKGLCETRKMKAAQSCLVEMLDKGLNPDQGTYEPFIIGYCRKGQLQNAERYLLQMLHHGFKPNKEVYSALISANCKSG